MLYRKLINLFFCNILFVGLFGVCVVSAAPLKNESSKATRTDRLFHYMNQLNSTPSARNELVTIILETDFIDAATKQLLDTLGTKVRYKFGRNHEIRVPAGLFFNVIGRLPKSVRARLPYPHESVSTTSQSVAIVGGEDMQALSVSGSGIKIGIIDLGFGSYTSAQASGDLPAVLSITDYSGTGTGGTNHGTQVAEVAYDMAPNAEFYLAKIATTTQLQQALDDMAAAGVRVINHSVAWFGASFYDGTGQLCDITDSAQSSGMLWINAMGNSRAKHYLGMFTDADSNLEHEFSAGNNFNTISLTSGTAVTLVLNWDDYPVSRADYNLYLYDGDPAAGAALVASSQNSQSGFGGTPYESITYTPVKTSTHYIVVRKSSSNTADFRLTLFSLGPDLGAKTYASSVTQPADCASVFSIGATTLTDGPEWFSSEGPTTDGRNKPEVSAPDRVVTSLSTSFAGTSASSPNIAGAAALLLSQNPALTTTQLRNILIADAQDVSVSGYDSRTGSGRISLDADLDTVNHDTDNCALVSNLNQRDLDSDGLGDVCDADIDGDGLSNVDENNIGTNPENIDTDGDGLTDGSEVDVYLTSPLLTDTDSDGLTDGDEVLSYATDPNASNIGDLAPRDATDNNLNTADLLVLMRLIEQFDSPSVYEQIVGDINSDGVLDIRDALMLRRTLGF